MTSNRNQEDTNELNVPSDGTQKKHEKLSNAVEIAQRSPGVDDLEVSRLKKQKLHLKEEITRLSAG